MAAEDDLDLLAGEYVLGTLSADERAAVERRLLDHPDLARRIEAWGARLAPLSEDLEPIAPRPQVWQRLRRSLAVRPKPAPPLPWWSRIGFWRGWAGAATAAAIALASFMVTVPTPPQLVAVLNDGSGRPLWVVRAAVDAGSLLARPVAAPVPMPTVPELWLLPAGGGRPVSLGVLDSSGSNRRNLVAPVHDLLRAGNVLAVSLEPPGGSSTGQPTGPVVSTGTLVVEPR